MAGVNKAGLGAAGAAFFAGLAAGFGAGLTSALRRLTTLFSASSVAAAPLDEARRARLPFLGGIGSFCGSGGPNIPAQFSRRFSSQNILLKIFQLVVSVLIRVNLIKTDLIFFPCQNKLIWTDGQ